MAWTFSKSRLLPVMLWLFLVPTAFAQLSPGDLASAHEQLEGISNCTKCHELGEGPSADKCMACHTLIKDRLEARKGYHHVAVTVNDMACFDCHNDHAGREFELVHWPDGQDDFDHAAIGFPLVGKHAPLPCRDCHNPALIREDLKKREPEKDMTRTFLGLGTDCLSCHADEHRGQLGVDCLRCHNNDRFKPVATFSHDSARFVLTGKHRPLDCQKCHPKVRDPQATDPSRALFTNYTRLQFANCTTCHKDKHEGKFGADCTRCHSTAGWRQIAGTGDFDHNTTVFPLVGKHASVACDRCHKSTSLLAKIKHEACTDCHRDAHWGQFASRPDGGRCESCHNEKGFLPPRYTIEDHGKTEFALVGAHLAQPCIACHEMETAIDGSTYRNFRVAFEPCTACHTDPHGGQFATVEPLRQCTDCHGNATWRAVPIDQDHHDAYPLVGAHKKVACSGCHKPEIINEVTTVRYRPIAHRCEDCHRPGSLSEEL